MSRCFSFSGMRLPWIIPWKMCFVVFAWIVCLTPFTSHAQRIATPSWRQPRPAASTLVLASSQEDRWREQEIQRYAPGQQANLMDEKSSDYLKLVVFPLMLFILALAVVRLRDF